MKIIECLVLLMLVFVPAYSTILMRNTYEIYEGQTPQQCGWNTSNSGGGLLNIDIEDPNNGYQTQSHGEYCLHIYDPNNNSHANASKTFSNTASEYMTEFYMWIPVDHQPIDSFPLCVLWNVALPETLYPELQFKTDIALVLDSVGVPPNGTPFYVHVQDASGWHNNVAHIHSTDRWFKIQIHRHEGVVDFYLDGELEGTFQPMNSSQVSNKIVLGTTQADSLADGEVFYDDVIISTPPSGEHPRLLFTNNDLSTLRARKSSETYTYLGLKYKDIWAKLDSFADHFMDETDTIVWKKDGPTDTLCDTFEYPYEQFTFLPRNDTIEFWLGPQRRVSSELLTLSFVALVDTTADSIRSHAEGLLAALSHWQMWNDPYFRAGWKEYIQLGVGHYMYSIALAYDWLYDYLSNYERLSIQNTLINLGINQTYLEARYGSWGGDPSVWPNGTAVMIGGMGLGCLALDGCDLTSEFDTAEARIDALLSDSTVCDPAGGFAEGVSYAGYAVDHLVTFCEANNSLNSYATGNKFLGNYPDWRIWCMLPGAEQYYTKEYCEPTYWDVTFCDYDHRGGIWSTAIARIADETNDSEARWFLKRRKDLDFYGKDYSQNRKFSRWDIYLPFGLFLWVDAGDTSKPNPDTLLKSFDNVGWTIARTGWQDDDYLLALKSGPWFERHNHHEQGSFIFGGDGRWLIADMGYAIQKSQDSAEYHNVFYDSTSELLYRCPHNFESQFTNADNRTFSYLESIGDATGTSISPWQRSIVFFNELGSFAVSDQAVSNGAVDTMSWRLHTWVEPDTSDGGKTVDISYSGGPYLKGHIVYPESISTKDSLLPDIVHYENNASDTFYFHRLQIAVPSDSSDSLDVFRFVVGFAPYNDSDSVAVDPVAGVYFTGTKVMNERGTGCVVFGLDDSIKGGKYTVSVTDTLCNVVCNLIPDTNYVVVVRRDTFPETDTTMQSDSLGVSWLQLTDPGNVQVLITLARTTGSIQINNDSAYCNMPYVELNLAMTNPLDSQSVDSMRIWQKYLDPPETWNYDSTGWIPYDSTYFWYLRQGEGANVVYAQFMADGWNESVEYCDTIIFDATAASGSFAINDDSTFSNSSNVTLKNSLNDVRSGVAQMRFGNEYLENLVLNSAFGSSGNWEYDSAIYHGSLALFEIPSDSAGAYFYQAIQPESLADFDEDTLLVWVDLVSDGFNGTGRVEFQYVYDDPDSVDPKGEFPCGASITIPLGTAAHVSHYNLCSLFVYEEPATNWYEARVGVFISPDAGNQGRLFIDNLRLDVVSPYDDYSKFEFYDSTKSWVLNSGNGMRKVFGQFSDGAGNETGVLSDTIVVDTTLPAAHISSPQSDQVISGTVEIAGWAFDYADPNQHFRQYELLYQSYSSENWYGVDPDSLSYIPEDSSSPPGLLGKWETETVSDGWYYLKLVVCDSASNERDDTISVCVSNKPKGKGEMSGFSNNVYGLAVRNSIYVGESGTGMIHRYSLNFQPIDTFSIVDSSGIGFPLAMMIDDFGNLWVVNITNHSINQFTTQGNLLWQFAGGFDMPSGVTLDNSGNVWISDRLHHKIKGYSITGNLLRAFGIQGKEPGEIARPIGIAIHDGKIYIADSKNKRISVFDTLGSFIDVIGDSSGLLMPFGLAMDSSGCLFVSDFVGNQIIEFGPSGNRLFGIDSSLDSPTGLAFSSDAKTLYVSDTENKRVLAYEVRSEPPLTGGGPQAMGEVDINKLSFDIFPSPFASRLTIRLQGVAGNRLTLKFYDVTGRLIKTFLDNDLVNRDQNIIWDGHDNQQRKCAAGIYFLRLEIGEYRDMQKVVLMR